MEISCSMSESAAEGKEVVLASFSSSACPELGVRGGGWEALSGSLGETSTSLDIGRGGSAVVDRWIISGSG